MDTSETKPAGHFLPALGRGDRTVYVQVRDDRLAGDEVPLFRHPPALRAGAPTDEDLRALWREAGGRFHGPIVETGTMPEHMLLPFLRGMIALSRREEVKA